MSIREKIVNFLINHSVSFSILIGGLSYLAVVNNSTIIQFLLIIITCFILVVWTTIDKVQNKIPNQPTSYFILGLFITQLLTFEYISSSYEYTTTFESYFTIIFSLISGFVIWHISITLIAIFISSTTDISFDNNQDINDPYNDKHAARILNETKNN